MLYNIKENIFLLEIFDEQTNIWWNNTNILDIIIHLTQKYITENFNIFNITIIIKMKLQSLIDKPLELLDFINESLKPKNSEKKKYGEVFTPLSLINEILDKLPENVWKNPNLKWFDPANGIGNFMVIIYYRLMNSLSIIIPNDKLRKKHILENMLYMSEINKKNCYIMNKIFNINNEYSMNIHNGNTLELNIKTKWNIDNFDIIVGNPPYNISNEKSTGNTLWQHFVNLSINNFLKNKRYLCFIHPNGWRKPETTNPKYGNLFELLTKDNQLLYLEIHDIKDGIEKFNCATRYDWYVLHKKRIYKNTLIKDETGVLHEINLSKWTFLPNYLYVTIEKIITNNRNTSNIIYNRSNYGADTKHVKHIKNNEYKYPLIHSTPKNGVRYCYSSTNNNGHFGIKKVIFGESGINNAIIDEAGEYGMTQGAMAIPFNNIIEANKIKNAIESKTFQNILKACSWSNYRIEWKLFLYFKTNFYDYISDDNIDTIQIKNPKKYRIKLKLKTK